MTPPVLGEIWKLEQVKNLPVSCYRFGDSLIIDERKSHVLIKKNPDQQASSQWLFLVLLKGGIGSIVHPPIGSIYHLYTTYILPSGGLYATYHLLREPV